VPRGLLYATAAMLEQRVSGTTVIVDDMFDAIVAAGAPAEGLAVHLRLNALARRGRLDGLISTIAGFNRVAAELGTHFGGANVQVAEMGREYVGLALLSHSIANELTNTTLLRLIADAESFDLSGISRWLVRGVDFLADPSGAINVLLTGGESDQERLMAALVVSSMSNVDAKGIFIAQQACVALLGSANGQLPVLEVVLAASIAGWSRALERAELFPDGSAETRERLRAALGAEGTPRQRLLAIFRAAREATQASFHQPVEAFLTEESS